MLDAPVIALLGCAVVPDVVMTAPCTFVGLDVVMLAIVRAVTAPADFSRDALGVVAGVCDFVLTTAEFGFHGPYISPVNTFTLRIRTPCPNVRAHAAISSGVHGMGVM